MIVYFGDLSNNIKYICNKPGSYILYDKRNILYHIFNMYKSYETINLPLSIVLNIGETIYFQSRDSLYKKTANNSTSLFELYEIGEHLSAIWTQDGDIYYYQCGRLIKSEKKLKTITTYRGFTIPNGQDNPYFFDLDVKLKDIIINTSQSQYYSLINPDLDSQQQQLNLSGIYNNSISNFIYYYLEQDTVYTVVTTFSKIEINNILSVYEDTEFEYSTHFTDLSTYYYLPIKSDSFNFSLIEGNISNIQDTPFEWKFHTDDPIAYNFFVKAIFYQRPEFSFGNVEYSFSARILPSVGSSVTNEVISKYNQDGTNTPIQNIVKFSTNNIFKDLNLKFGTYVKNNETGKVFSHSSRIHVTVTRVS